MKRSNFMFMACLMAIHVQAQNITIIESQTGNEWAVQDTIWRGVAEGMGLSPTVAPQSTLELLSNLSATDVLILSSGTITLPPAHLQTVIDFVLGGGSVYVQSEYQSTMQGSITFEALMQAIGADFSWSSTISGQLTPMNITGVLSTTPNNVSALNYFNYGLAGSGSGVAAFLEYSGNYFGFHYVDPSHVIGSVITISDEDWAWNNASPELMENILTQLLDQTSSTTDHERSMDGLWLYPNPTNGVLTIDPGNVRAPVSVIIRDVHGRIVQTREYTGTPIADLRLEGPSGVYFVSIGSEGRNDVIRVVKH